MPTGSGQPELFHYVTCPRMGSDLMYNKGVQNASIQMPASAKSATVSTVAPKKPARKTRARKANSPVKPVAPRTRKAAATPQPQTPKVKMVELKSILKDYPRDGFALILLPVLLLEAMVKEILPVLGRIKVPASFG